MRVPWVTAWLHAFRAAQRYFRFECEGFDHLRGPSGLIVGYHGGPWALDIFMLSARMHDELGWLPRAIWLDTWSRLRITRDMVSALDGLYGEPDEACVAQMRARGQHLVVLPGGTREGLRPYSRRRRVDFGGRRGYLRLALQHGLPIYPVVAVGLEETYFGLNDGYRLSKALFGNGSTPLWLGVGVLGLWPFALPWPARIRQRIGPAIDPAELRRAGTESAHQHVVGTLQRMLDDLSSKENT